MSLRRTLSLLLGLLALGLLALGAAWWSLQGALKQPLALEQEQIIEVAKGSSPAQQLNRLQAEGVLEGARWLRWYWRFEVQKPLHSGEYRLTPGMSAADLLGLWARGEVVQYNLTLVEGWTFRQVREHLAGQQALQQSLTGLSDAELMARLGKPGWSPEGRFFPDTYRYVRGMQDLDLLRQALEKHEAVLAEEWAKRDLELPYADPYQALIMASLVEKETGLASERPEIAGVFVRRLRLGMRLQTDPTVIFGLGERYQGNLTRTHLRQSTPYNTYVIAGLPPTPIALVGREAIHAALHPRPGDSLYFVARGDGSHVFSRTLAEHNRAVREYQLQRRADYRSSPAPQKKE